MGVLSVIGQWLLRNPWKAALIASLISLAVYKGMASYYKNESAAAGEIVRQQNATLKSVEKQNEVKREIEHLPVGAANERLLNRWCRDC